jgi:hypothetical protein
MRLLLTELRRFWARRAVRWLIALALGIIALAMVITAVNSKVKNNGSFVTTCTTLATPTAPGATPAPPDFSGPGCVTTASGTVDNRFDLEHDLRDAIAGTGVAFLLLAILFGTTFIGADYAGGSLPGQLTFEPRRTFMYLTKAVAVTIATVLITIFLLLVVCGALAGVAQARGIVGDTGGTWLWHRFADIARVAAVCGVAGAIGFAITTVARRSVVAVVAFLAFAFILEPALTHAIGFFQGKTPVIALIATTLDDFTDAPEGVTTLAGSVLVGGLWAAALLLIGGMVFARREVR